MKKILLLLIACFALGASAQKQPSNVQLTPATAAPAQTELTDTTKTDQTELEKAQKEIQVLQKKIQRLQKQIDDNDFPIQALAIICVFGLPTIIIILWLYFRSKNKQAKLRTIERLLDSGNPNVAEIYEKLTEEKPRKNLLQKGIITMCVGIGIFIFLWFSDNESWASVGLLIAFIGIGETIAGYLQKKDIEKKEAKNNKFQDAIIVEDQSKDDHMPIVK